MSTSLMFPPTASKPISQYGYAGNLGPVKTGFGPFDGSSVALLRDNFTILTWILLGCIVQYLLSLALRPSFAVLPALLIICWGIIDVLLMTLGVKTNAWSKNVIDGKFAAAYPAEGERSAITKPAENGPGAVMILGTRSNSPLGMFAPGFKETGDRFRDMVAQLEKDKTAGFMGMSTWIGTERSSSNELATFSYWRSIEDIHNFALTPIHRDTWNWWNNAVVKGGFKHIGLMHEIFEVPKKNGFEGIYVHYQPTGLTATTRLVVGGEKGQDEWIVPIVNAARGPWRSSRGRMARGDETGSSNDKIALDAYGV